MILFCLIKNNSRLESKDALMDTVMKRHPYLIDLVVELTDEAWERNNEERDSRTKKVLVG